MSKGSGRASAEKIHGLRANPLVIDSEPTPTSGPCVFDCSRLVDLNTVLLDPSPTLSATTADPSVTLPPTVSAAASTPPIGSSTFSPLTTLSDTASSLLCSSSLMPCRSDMFVGPGSSATQDISPSGAMTPTNRPASQPPAQTQTPGLSHKTNRGAIAGGVAGAVFIIGAAFALFLCRRFRLRRFRGPTMADSLPDRAHPFTDLEEGQTVLVLGHDRPLSLGMVYSETWEETVIKPAGQHGQSQSNHLTDADRLGGRENGAGPTTDEAGGNQNGASPAIDEAGGNQNGAGPTIDEAGGNQNGADEMAGSVVLETQMRAMAQRMALVEVQLQIRSPADEDPPGYTAHQLN
ncbi:hypothetical protein GGX14DRAFT_575768 [Mycena pura]|uniref:Uncharacterized protein n=1 Tax=Mycena pura TaxID=153505 RepID=A0AAD6UV81_9AGAR|nr:hypothetical protein GGX14DRAFT_575768 [Mycena pura]